LSFLLIVVLFLSFAIHHDEYGDRCFSCCHCYRIVCTYSTGCTVRYYLYTRCTLSFVPCWYDNSTLPVCISVSHSFFCELNIVHHFPPQTSLFSFLSPSASCSTTVSLPLVPREFEHCCLVVLVDCRLVLVVCDSP
jgi:hypothetical protein